MSPMLCGNTKPLAIQDATYFGMPVADMQNYIIVMGGVFTKTIPVSNGTIGCCRMDMCRNMMSPMLCGNTKPLAIQDATYFGMPVADMQN